MTPEVFPEVRPTLTIFILSFGATTPRGTPIPEMSDRKSFKRAAVGVASAQSTVFTNAPPVTNFLKLRRWATTSRGFRPPSSLDGDRIGSPSSPFR